MNKRNKEKRRKIKTRSKGDKDMKKFLSKKQKNKRIVQEPKHSRVFDSDGANLCVVVNIDKTGYASLKQLSGNIVDIELPKQYCKNIEKDDMLRIEVESRMTESGDMEVRILDIRNFTKGVKAS